MMCPILLDIIEASPYLRTSPSCKLNLFWNFCSIENNFWRDSMLWMKQINTKIIKQKPRLDAPQTLWWWTGTSTSYKISNVLYALKTRRPVADLFNEGTALLGRIHSLSSDSFDARTLNTTYRDNLIAGETLLGRTDSTEMNSLIYPVLLYINSIILFDSSKSYVSYVSVNDSPARPATSSSTYSVYNSIINLYQRNSQKKISEYEGMYNMKVIYHYCLLHMTLPNKNIQHILAQAVNLP